MRALSTETFARPSLDAEHSSRKVFELQRERTEVKFEIWSRSRNSVLLVLTAIFEALVVIALEAVIFEKFKPFSKKELGTGIPVYLIIFILSQVFQVALAWDAVRAQNTIQVIALLLFNLCCFGYAVFQFKQIFKALDAYTEISAQVLRQLIEHLLIVNAVITGVCQLIYFYLGARLYQEFGWRIYKKIGADPEIRNMYRWYQILLTILKLDIFFFLGYSIQYLVLVLKNNDSEFPLTITALPLTCLFLILTVYAVRRESTPLVLLVFLGLAAGCAYFIFKICRMYQPDQEYKYVYVNEFLTFFASVSLLLVVLTIINVAICWRNFHKGLKPHLLRDHRTSSLTHNPGERTLSLD
ncbi:uncharacterized protein BYT42DRAFT_588504 [Radiomyces spectabilis]|uniref:uncharacterized protein n=1 Tax=Radiomyces spectabilis TaxID=64574 RepID=UPI00221E5D02|nr:uncharacterized protein BYT42DRAFT_588504 [Radiomyces spectabilis]KAI8365997.1 hypothetical protein BYT42DRAFT_588504 [Radiomyces spectabilis]